MGFDGKLFDKNLPGVSWVSSKPIKVLKNAWKVKYTCMNKYTFIVCWKNVCKSRFSNFSNKNDSVFAYVVIIYLLHFELCGCES